MRSRLAVNCGHLDKKHKGLGLCESCYATFLYGSSDKFRDTKRRVGLNGRIRLKMEVLSHYSPNEILGCSCPGCNAPAWLEFLTIDHVAEDGQSHVGDDGYKLNGNDLYRWLKSHEFPEGFQTMCLNCNHAKGHFGECPHMRGRA